MKARARPAKRKPRGFTSPVQVSVVEPVPFFVCERLLHLSDGNSDEAMFKRMVQRVAGVPVYVEGEK